MYYILNIQKNSTLCFFRYIPAYSIIISFIKAYSLILRHQSIVRLIQLYSVPCVTRCHNLAIFWSLAYLELEAYLKPSEALTRHFQNPTITHYSAVFRHIQNLVQRFHLQKLGTPGIVENSKSFLNCIPMYIQNHVIFTKICECLELRNLSKIYDGVFCKNS